MSNREHLIIRLALDELSRVENTFEGVIYMVGKSKNPLVLTEGSRVSAERVFTGALMFADHPSWSEEFDRPERSVRNAIGKVLSAYPGDVDGKPALLGKFKISKSETALLDKIDEGIITGLSLNAYADGSFDEEQGVFILERFLDPDIDNVLPPSVDLVTYPAAGGAMGVRLSKTFSAKSGIIVTNVSENQSENTMPTEEITALKAQMSRQREGLKVYQSTLFDISHLPKPTQTRIMSSVERLIEAYTENGGELAQVQTDVEAAIESEVSYLQDMSKAGAPVGVSASTPVQSSGMSQDKIKAAINQYETIFR